MGSSKFFRRSLVVGLVCIIGFAFTACAQIDELLPFDLPFLSSGQERDLVYIPMPEIPLGDSFYEIETLPEPPVMTPTLSDDYLTEGSVTVSIGNISRGYVKIKHDSDAYALVKIAKNDYEPDFFSINGNSEFEVFPLTRGNGLYTIQVLEYYVDRLFTIVFSRDIYVNLDNPNYPFLYPNRYVSFNENSEAVALAGRLASQVSSDFEVVQAVYNFITTNISFDLDFATAVNSGLVLEHTPDIDATLAAGTGICLDFAVLTAAMLRSQNIPTRLEVGYVLGIFHAWVAVYIPDADWGDAAHPSGGGWGLLDPTTTTANDADGFLRPLVDVNEYNVLFIR